jgi:hypothetical protein
MMIAPAHATGPSVLDVVTQTAHLWSQMLLTPLAWLAPPPDVALLQPSVPTLTDTASTHLTDLVARAEPVTDHALLVLLGHFARHLGLLDLFKAVPLKQKTFTHAPHTKLIEFLLAVLAGLGQLHELNDAATPLASDLTLAQAWGQPAFAHYSGVSRTLSAADADTLQAVLAALSRVSQPFIDRELQALLQSGRPVMLDIDLTGRPVSPTATTYPEAAFGWMDDAVAKGYQSAISSLSGGPTGRLLLTTQRYGGQAKSAECLQNAVAAVEATLGLRPRRRVEVVQAQLDELTSQLAALERPLAAAWEAHDTAQWKREQHVRGVTHHDERFLGRQERLQRREERTLARLARVRAQQARLREQIAAATKRVAELTAENQALPTAVRIIIRLDAGFSTDANLAWLIEMGYTVLTKVHSGHTTRRLQRTVDSEAVWTEVGANAEALALGPQGVGEGRARLEALQVRYALPTGWRYTSLLFYGEGPPPEPKAWFEQYNGRQTVEAGIKENKGVFTMRRPLVRSPVGMQLQEAFALFAANFVRWAAAWVQSQVRNVPPALGKALREVKTLIRVLAHSPAQVVITETGCGLVFDGDSPFAGAVLVIHGDPVYQTVLPLFTVRAIAPQEVT